jgi:hypothetical protein
MTLIDAQIRLTAQEAQLTAEEFAINQIGDQVVAGEPWPINSPLRGGWVVPLILTRPTYGPVGAIGVVVVDSNTGQVVAATPKENLTEQSDRLLTEKENDLSAAFQKLMIEEHPLS